MKKKINIIAELFYTKKIKALISDLKDIKRLNEMSLENLNKELNKVFLKNIFIWLLFWLGISIYYGELIYSIITLPIAFILVYLDMKHRSKYYCDRITYLITIGERTKGVITRINKYTGNLWIPIGINYYYSFKVNSQNYNNLLRVLNKYTAQKILKTNSVIIAFDNNNPNDSVIVLANIDNLFNLKKKEIKK